MRFKGDFYFFSEEAAEATETCLPVTGEQSTQRDPTPERLLIGSSDWLLLTS